MSTLEIRLCKIPPDLVLYLWETQLRPFHLLAGRGVCTFLRGILPPPDARRSPRWLLLEAGEWDLHNAHYRRLSMKRYALACATHGHLELLRRTLRALGPWYDYNFQRRLIYRAADSLQTECTCFLLETIYPTKECMWYTIRDRIFRALQKNPHIPVDIQKHYLDIIATSSPPYLDGLRPIPNASCHERIMALFAGGPELSQLACKFLRRIMCYRNDVDYLPLIASSIEHMDHQQLDSWLLCIFKTRSIRMLEAFPYREDCAPDLLLEGLSAVPLVYQWCHDTRFVEAVFAKFANGTPFSWLTPHIFPHLVRFISGDLMSLALASCLDLLVTYRTRGFLRECISVAVEGANADVLRVLAAVPTDLPIYPTHEQRPRWMHTTWVLRYDQILTMLVAKGALDCLRVLVPLFHLRPAAPRGPETLPTLLDRFWFQNPPDPLRPPVVPNHWPNGALAGALQRDDVATLRYCVSHGAQLGRESRPLSRMTDVVVRFPQATRCHRFLRRHQEAFAYMPAVPQSTPLGIFNALALFLFLTCLLTPYNTPFRVFTAPSLLLFLVGPAICVVRALVLLDIITFNFYTTHTRVYSSGAPLARAHSSTWGCLFSMAYAHTCSFQGAGGVCSRNHFRVSRWPLHAAWVQDHSSHGAGGVCARAQRSTSNWPLSAASAHTPSSHGAGGLHTQPCTASWRAAGSVGHGASILSLVPLATGENGVYPLLGASPSMIRKPRAPQANGTAADMFSKGAA